MGQVGVISNDGRCRGVSKGKLPGGSAPLGARSKPRALEHARV